MGTGLPTSASKDPKSSVKTPNNGDLSMLRTVQVIIPGTKARAKILNWNSRTHPPPPKKRGQNTKVIDICRQCQENIIIMEARESLRRNLLSF